MPRQKYRTLITAIRGSMMFPPGSIIHIDARDEWQIEPGYIEAVPDDTPITPGGELPDDEDSPYAVYEAMTVAELRELAEQHHVDVPNRISKPDLISLLAGAV